MTDAVAPQSGRPRFSILAFLATLALVSYAWYLLMVQVPRFETIFKDFGTKLPASTQMLMDFGRWIERLPGHLGYALFGLPIVMGFVVAAVGQRVAMQTQEALLRQLRWLVALLFVIAMLFAMNMLTSTLLMQPYLELIQNISSPSH